MPKLPYFKAAEFRGNPAESEFDYINKYGWGVLHVTDHFAKYKMFTSKSVVGCASKKP